MESKVALSVLIPVKNEIRNIRECIESVKWADEIFVVDSKSDDGTAEVATSLGATVVQFAYFGRPPKKKNWSLDNLAFRNEWVLIVDADERITGELASEIRKAISSEQYEGYYVNRRYYFLGRLIRHCGWYPSWNLRLFRHRLGRYELLIGAEGDDNRTGDNEVHEHLLLKGRAGHLSSDMIHVECSDLFEWVEKHNRYSSWEAAVYCKLRRGAIARSLNARALGHPIERKRLLKHLWVWLPFRSFVRFLHMYLFHLGFLDGIPGYYFCRLHAMHQLIISAKSYERKLRSRAAVAEPGNDR